MPLTDYLKTILVPLRMDTLFNTKYVFHAFNIILHGEQGVAKGREM